MDKVCTQSFLRKI